MKINKFFVNYIKEKAKRVGVDEFGNSYYEEKSKKTCKRYVIYKGINEPSKIPSEWHAWLHYSSNETGDKTNIKKYSWQKIHLPNLTGTIYSSIYNNNDSKN